MKLMTYNILKGASNKLKSVIPIIKKISPDVLTINEANTFASDNNKILKILSEETGLINYKLALSGEFDYHVAFLSRYPIIKSEIIAPLARAGIHSIVDTELGTVSIVSTHLTPYDEDSRLTEISLISKVQKDYTNKILTGDMNSLAKYDNYDPKIISAFNKIQIKKFTVNGKFRFDAIEKILSYGYVDSAFFLNKNNISTAPTKINEYDVHKNMRLDYVFLSKPLIRSLTSYDVVKNKLTNRVSDHYPVVVELSDI